MLLSDKQYEKLTDLFIPEIDYRDILNMDSKVGFKPSFHIENKIIEIGNVPSHLIRKKYRLISHEVPNHYYQNIKLIRKLESFLECKPFQLYVANDYSHLINESFCHLNIKNNTLYYREKYEIICYPSKVSGLKDPFYISTDEFIFLSELNKMLNPLVEEIYNKSFSDLTKDELMTVKMYHE